MYCLYSLIDFLMTSAGLPISAINDRPFVIIFVDWKMKRWKECICVHCWQKNSLCSITLHSSYNQRRLNNWGIISLLPQRFLTSFSADLSDKLYLWRGESCFYRHFCLALQILSWSKVMLILNRHFLMPHYNGVNRWVFFCQKNTLWLMWTHC